MTTRPYLGRSLVLLCLLLLGCGGKDASSPTSPSSNPTSPSTNPAAPPLPGFSLQGDPESGSGATWTYKGTLGGVAYDLQGLLFKPAGAGPFGAVIVSHGAGGAAAASIPRGTALEMRRWGLVTIATNYTHSAGVPIGAPGTAGEPGASEANVLRAHAVREILRTLSYVDQNRVAAHGHSMGAFVTTALVGAYPNDFRVASHTAGGVQVLGATSLSGPGGPAPTEAQAQAVHTPYQMHHGDQDTTVPIVQEQRYDEILRADSVSHEFFVYPGASHNDPSLDPTMFSRVRAWYSSHGMM